MIISKEGTLTFDDLSFNAIKSLRRRGNPRKKANSVLERFGCPPGIRIPVR